MEQTVIVVRYHAEKPNSWLQLCVRRTRSVFEFDLATRVSHSCSMIRKKLFETLVSDADWLA